MSIELSDIQVLIVDVDGTITDNKGYLDIRAVEKIRELERTGIMVSLASGNALPVTKALSTYIGASGPIIAETGCVVEMLEDIKIFGDPKRTREALKILKAYYGDRIKESWSNRYRHVDIAIRQTLPKEYITRLLVEFEDLVVLDSKFAYHIHPRGIDKGYALEIISDLINLPQEYFASIGDSELDIPLLEKTGYSVAVRNSPEKLIEIADYTTEGSYADGFIEFADILISEKKRGLRR
jgi:hypothetical protein